MTREEAIEIIKTQYPHDHVMKTALGLLIPELHENESKDERIRKALIDALKVSETIGELKFRLPYPTREECIAYLEKQKEPTTEELYAEAGTTEKEYIANTMKMVRAMREKKQEQKPMEIDFEDWDTLGYIRDIVRKHVRRDEEFNVLDKWLTEHYVNQKSAWGEEDEKMVRFYEDDYDNNLGNMPMCDVIENRIKFKDWLLNRLKFLRPQSQKLEEWTEEDERMWKSALWHIKNSCGNGGKNSGEFEVYQWFKNRVKSLRLIKQEWNEEDEKNLKQCIEIVRGWEIDYDYANPHYSNWLKSVRLQTHEEVYQSVKHDLAIKFMNYLDENRPECKMSLSNGECKDIDKAFKENDWAKIVRYVEKYKPHWKPSEEQMKGLKFFLDFHRPQRNAGTTNWREYDAVESLYEQLKKL